MRRPWTEEDIERILVDPFSSLVIASRLTEEHEPSMTTDKWVQVNAGFIQDIGAEAWLQQVVNILEGKGAVDTPINPYNVINIAPHFAVEHEPIMPRDEWIKANAKLMPQRGIERWLRIFLDILEGDIPTASNLGLGPFPVVPFGYAPAGYKPRPRHSFSQGGKRKNKKKRKG